ncbi:MULTISPECIES: YgjV family protein [Flavobacterium]|jgi:uncharacterized membrane protein|uniref:YgjV family protein n=1 Tax=Flavobacterium cupriresistens TaxID=2893885 RepID=A0ABU4RBD8_9FLAO|nr:MULTISPECIES: YgjV family protein [unclassified Flavobacterium]MDX6189897.1 YgjV family protein [Flavobacterium sp. Fl-318]UFH42722.1 YgjV family protein [Flavobacterium sp. F-323]
MLSLITDLIGYLGITINLFSMSLKGERKLRLFSLIANSIYITYGMLIGAIPIVIGSSIAVLLHTYRLRKINSD